MLLCQLCYLQAIHCYYNFMQINIEIKQKHSKTNTWDHHDPSYILDNPSNKKHRYSPKSYRQQHRPITNEHNQREIKITNSHKKISSVHKSSSNKIKDEKKYSTLKKNPSNKLKKTKDKPSIISQSHLLEYDKLRGSLPGLSGKKILQYFQPILSENQRLQLINQKTVYYVGIGSGIGQDDLEGRYMWKKHEQVGYRYQLLQSMGRGAFGQVIKAFDHKVRELVAVKVVRGGSQHMQLALNEISILMKIKEQDIQNRKNLLRIKDFIVFRKHICIITQLLATNLFQLLQVNHFQSLNMHNIKAFAIQILASLAFLKQIGIIHSDLKPQNILLKSKQKVGIKLIDFGTSMFIKQTNFSYIQSRFYRAPQVILGAKYNYPIDMWSFGCVIAQLYLGYPLFSGDNEQQQLSLIIKTFGTPAKQYITSCKNTQKYFNKDFSAKIIKGKDGRALIPLSKPLDSIIKDEQLCNFLQRILKIVPQQRLTPLKALIEPWILSYFPENIKKQHLNEIMLKIKKEQGDSLNKLLENKSLPIQKSHKKRNSQLHTTVKVKHKRNGSQGFM